MQHLDSLRQRLPEVAKDLKLNLSNTLSESSLTPDQLWGVAVACALASRNAELSSATLADASAAASAEAIEDGKAAAALMGMNNIYYRFRHMVGKEVYNSTPAKLRMTRIVKPLTNKTDFELFCLAVSAINGCEACVRSHEKIVTEGGLTPEQVNDAIRIAATMHAVAVALEIPVQVLTF